MDFFELSREIITGRRLSASDSFSDFYTGSLDQLCSAANNLQNFFCQDKIELCAITSGRNGHCSENCRFCAQSSWYKTGCKVQAFPEAPQLLQEALSNAGKGISRFSIVSSGRGLSFEDTKKAIQAFSLIKSNTDFKLCASLGFITDEQLLALKATGVSRIHCNLEASKSFFPKVCTSHTYEMKIDMIRRAKKAGFSICSGGIIGMGESFEDRKDLALALADLKVDSIPLNVLTPIPGTPFEKLPILSEEEILRTTALFRFINPAADIRLAGGRKLYDSSKAFTSGASATITGDYLTTYGYSVESDKKMIEAIGKKLK